MYNRKVETLNRAHWELSSGYSFAMITASASWNKCWTSGIPIYMHMQLSYIDAHSGGFRAARLPQAGDTDSRATMSQLSAWSNKHNWPEFYPGNARACPGLEPPMDAHSIRELLQQCMFILTADTSFGWGKEPHFLLVVSLQAHFEPDEFCTGDYNTRMIASKN